MARQVELTLEATAFVRRGERVFLKARPKHAKWIGWRRFFFSSDSGEVFPGGGNGSRAYIETHDLEPGSYLVKAHFEQHGLTPLDAADAAATFLVTE